MLQLAARERLWLLALSLEIFYYRLTNRSVTAHFEAPQHAQGDHKAMSAPDAAADAMPPPRPDAAAAMPPPIPQNSKTNPDLPIAGARADIVRLLREHDFLVVVGDTGSGKTTQLPAYLLAVSYTHLTLPTKA